MQRFKNEHRTMPSVNDRACLVTEIKKKKYKFDDSISMWSLVESKFLLRAASLICIMNICFLCHGVHIIARVKRWPHKLIESLWNGTEFNTPCVVLRKYQFHKDDRIVILSREKHAEVIMFALNCTRRTLVVMPLSFPWLYVAWSPESCVCACKKRNVCVYACMCTREILGEIRQDNK